jgi:hypothetical protein
MRCPACQAEFQKIVKFCTKCGTAIPEDAIKDSSSESPPLHSDKRGGSDPDIEIPAEVKEVGDKLKEAGREVSDLIKKTVQSDEAKEAAEKLKEAGKVLGGEAKRLFGQWKNKFKK